jgi:predicted  nucleic acid-binding Zn ribbon protein
MSNYDFSPEEQLILTKIDFGIPKRRCVKAAGGMVEEYLAALLYNGQIGAGDLIQERPKYVAYVQATDDKALEPQYLSPWGKRCSDVILSAFGHKPKFVLLEPSLKRRGLSWRSAKTLFLHTDTFKSGSPVGSPELLGAVPVYQLPLSHQDRDYLVRWARQYRNHDSLWLGCGKLEVAAYREMADPKSELSREGREHCRIIEDATGIPTYYSQAHNYR